jgi:transposase
VARRGRPAPALVLTDEERETLRASSDDDTASPDARLRARIVLACAEGTSNVEVALMLGVNRMTVAKWRTRFTGQRLPGLRDDARSGRPRALTPDEIAAVIGATVDAWPPGTRWSRGSMAQRTGLSKSTVGRIWREYGIAPHQVRPSDQGAGWSPTGRTVDIAGLYLHPPRRALALCADPAPVDRAVDWSSPVARPRRADNANSLTVRRTVTNLLGRLGVDGAAQSGSEAAQFERFLSTLDGAVPVGRNIRVLCGGFDDALCQEMEPWLMRHPRFQLDVVAAPAAWTFHIGQWLFLLADRAFGRAGAESVVSLDTEVASWAPTWTAHAQPLLWVKPANDQDG